MKLFKVGVILSIGCIIIGSIKLGTSLGAFYKSSEIDHQYLEEKSVAMDVNKMNEIYIQSEIPIKIQEVEQEEVSVVFQKNLKAITLLEPEYNLEVVTNRSDSSTNQTYITFTKDEGVMIEIGNEEDEVLMVYLPKGDLAVLDVKGNEQAWHDSYVSYVGDNNIKELVINDLYVADLDLSGIYENIDIHTFTHGKIVVDSESEEQDKPTNVNVSGVDTVELLGKYENIEIKYVDEVSVYSETPYNIEIKHPHKSGGEIELSGIVNRVEVQADYMDIEIETIQTPQLIEIEGEQNDIDLFLPQNHEGFELVYNPYDKEQEEGILLGTNIEITTEQLVGNTSRVAFGEQKMKMKVEGDKTKLNIIE